jgi:hypothetical protein
MQKVFMRSIGEFMFNLEERLVENIAVNCHDIISTRMKEFAKLNNIPGKKGPAGLIVKKGEEKAVNIKAKT